MAQTMLMAAMLMESFMGAGKWHEDAFFGLHFDLHPGEQDTELGRETTHEHIRAMLRKVGPDFVQYDCKGHPGWSGYPTKVGSPSPGIVNDALRIWRDVTRDMGIPLSIHYSGVWDPRAVQLHPEWARIDGEGNPHPDNTDPLSAYTKDLLIPQLIEVVQEYDLDGVWIDGENWASHPSWSEACKTEFTRRTGIQEIPHAPADAHWFEWLAFQRDLFVEHVRQYADALHAVKPSVNVCSNWMYSVRQPEPVSAPVDYLSGDFDPSFGAARACAEARFLSSRGMPWDLMAWSFLNTGGQGWTTKTVPHLCQEVSIVLAQGGAVFIYDVPQRSGRLTEWHMDILAQVADFCRKRQAWCHKTQTVPQVAILHSQSYYYRHNDPLFNFGPANAPMEGALHALLENGYSVDILNEDMLMERMAQYPMIVVPEQDGLPDALRETLLQYVQAGGRLLVTGPEAAGEFTALTGVTPIDGRRIDNAFVTADGGCVTVAGPWQAVALNGATSLSPLLNQQEPERNQTGFPAATIYPYGAGMVAAIHGPVFRAYYRCHYPRLRRFLGEVAQSLAGGRLAQLRGPWWVEMALRTKDGHVLAQLVNRASAGHQSHDRHMVEYVPDAGSFTLTIPMESQPKRCYWSPDEAGLEWSWSEGMFTARIGGLAIHNTLVIEP